MKTIAGILMLAILVGSLFAGLVIAQEVEDRDEIESSVDAAEFATSEIGTDEVRDAFRRASEAGDSDLKKSSFAMVWRGIGHIENGREGYLVNAFWVEQKFAIATADAEILKEEIRAFGNFEIVGHDAHYRLIAGEVSDDSMRFYVVGRSEAVDDADEAERVKIGIIELKKVAEYSGLSKWEGTLEMRDGSFEGSWNVNIAAASKSLRPDFNFDSRDDEDRARIARADNAVSAEKNIDREDAIERANEAIREKQSFWDKFLNRIRA